MDENRNDYNFGIKYVISENIGILMNVRDVSCIPCKKNTEMSIVLNFILLQVFMGEKKMKFMIH